MGQKIIPIQNQSIQLTSRELLLKRYAPDNCLIYASKIKSISDAMALDSHSIGKIQREESKNFADALLLGWLVYLNEILNLKNSMSESQMMLASQLICEEFYMLKMSELTLLFKRIISGQYGKFYERLDIPTILTCFREYLEELSLIHI